MTTALPFVFFPQVKVTCDDDFFKQIDLFYSWSFKEKGFSNSKSEKFQTQLIIRYFRLCTVSLEMPHFHGLQAVLGLLRLVKVNILCHLIPFRSISCDDFWGTLWTHVYVQQEWSKEHVWCLLQVVNIVMENRRTEGLINRKQRREKKMWHLKPYLNGWQYTLLQFFKSQVYGTRLVSD